MNENEQIIIKLTEAIVKEEQAIPIYVEHIASTLFWSALNKEKQDKIKELLQILATDSAEHAKMLKEIEQLYQAKLSQ